MEKCGIKSSSKFYQLQVERGGGKLANDLRSRQHGHHEADAQLLLADLSFAVLVWGVTCFRAVRGGQLRVKLLQALASSFTC